MDSVPDSSKLENEDKNVSRRNVLKKSASMGALSIGSSIININRSKSGSITKTHIIETALIFDDLEIEDPYISYNDGIINYNIDVENSKMEIYGLTEDRAEILTNDKIEILNNKIGHSITEKEGKNINTLPIELGYRTSVSKSVKIRDYYKIPNISILNETEDVIVRHSDNIHTISPSEEDKIQLDRESIEVLQKSDELKRIQDSRAPDGERLVRKEPRTKELHTSPKLIVKNAGIIGIFDGIDN